MRVKVAVYEDIEEVKVYKKGMEHESKDCTIALSSVEVKRFNIGIKLERQETADREKGMFSIVYLVLFIRSKNREYN